MTPLCARIRTQLASAVFLIVGVGTVLACTPVPPPRPRPAATDPLGPMPPVALTPRFAPPIPQVFDGPGKSKVWLVERHELPFVRITVTVPYGSASDPTDAEGLAWVVSSMLQRGAGSRDEVEFAGAAKEIGAAFSTLPGRDRSSASIEVLSTNFEQAVRLLADAIVRPRHDEATWIRTQEEWVNNLRDRFQNVGWYANVVANTILYGKTHPYGHAVDGTRAAAERVVLADVKRWHKTIWRSDVATFIVTGDVTGTALRSALDESFRSWAPPATEPLPIREPAPPAQLAGRTFVIDRPAATSGDVILVQPAPRESHPDRPLLRMLDVELFRRLQKNLVDDHLWTYVVHTSVAPLRGSGCNVVRSWLRLDALSDGLREIRKEMRHLLTKDAIGAAMDSLHMNANALMADYYRRLEDTNDRLSERAALGIAPDDDAKTSERQWSATSKDLMDVAARYLDPASTTVIVVAPKQAALRALADNALPKPTLLDPETLLPLEPRADR